MSSSYSNVHQNQATMPTTAEDQIPGHDIFQMRRRSFVKQDRLD
jgi:hypothetical protein